MIENDSGTHGGCCGETFEIEHMFDNDERNSRGDPTVWHSAPSSYNKVQTLKFTFDHPINFNRLAIRKRRDLSNSADDQSRQEAYKNVCVVLDGNSSNQVCTDTRNGGFNGVSNTDRDLIIWTKVENLYLQVRTENRYL